MKFLRSALLSLSLAIVIPPVMADVVYEGLPVNGAAVFEQLKLEYYVGLIHVETLTRDVSQLASLPGPKRMALRVTVERWPAMRFAQQWNQLILINNDGKALNDNLMDVLAFTSFIKDELLAGDELTIDLNEEGATVVSLNGTAMIRTADSDLFNLLLNTWVGPRPPSSDFKRNMAALANGETASDLLARFESLRPSATRIAATATWTKLRAPADQSNEQVAEATPVRTPEETRISAPAARPVALAVVEETPARPAPAAPSAPADASPAPVEPASAVAPTEQEPAPTAPASPSAPVPAPTPAPAPETEPQLLAHAGEIGDVAPAPAKPVDLSSLLETYNSSLRRAVYQHVEYPRRAVSRNMEGLVVMRAIISRDGELLSVETLQSAEPLLDKAAMAAVREAAPFNPIEGLPTASQEFMIPVIFKLTQ